MRLCTKEGVSVCLFVTRSFGWGKINWNGDFWALLLGPSNIAAPDRLLTAPAHPPATTYWLCIRPWSFLLTCVSLCPKVGRLVSLWHFTFSLFLCFCNLWPHCSCQNRLVTSNTAPAHPQATGAAMYPTLFLSIFLPSTVLTCNMKHQAHPLMTEISCLVQKSSWLMLRRILISHRKWENEKMKNIRRM